MLLSFKNGKFILSRCNPFLKAPWKWMNGHSFETTSLKAAVQFRSYSDASAENVFNRTLAKYYETPCLPQLSFLDSHQREGIAWILKNSRTYLAHAPGAGKTCQAICAACLTPYAGQTLFIVPPTLTLNWQREIKQFTDMLGYYPTTSIIPITSKAETTDWTADFIICPDSMITKDWVYTKLLKLKLKFLAVDEASRFKEPLSWRSKAFYGGVHEGKTYSGLFQNIRHVVFLDGSPMPSRAMDLWAPTFALNPNAIEFMDYFEFGFHYCGPTLGYQKGTWDFKGSSNELELKQKLQKDFMHVVTEDKLSHPERLRSILFMSTDVRSLEMKSWEKKNLHKLSKPSEKLSQGDIASHRKELGIRKVKWVAQYVHYRLVEKGESILLFAWHREVCELLATELQNFKPFIVYGGVSNESREKAFTEFQNGKAKLIIGNISAMGRGHNLQKADRVIFAEFSWSNESNVQCEKRSSRRGNTKEFTRCEYICAPDSIDETVLKSVFRKEEMTRKIIG